MHGATHILRVRASAGQLHSGVSDGLSGAAPGGSLERRASPPGTHAAGVHGGSILLDLECLLRHTPQNSSASVPAHQKPTPPGTATLSSVREEHAGLARAARHREAQPIFGSHLSRKGIWLMETAAPP